MFEIKVTKIVAGIILLCFVIVSMKFKEYVSVQAQTVLSIAQDPAKPKSKPAKNKGVRKAKGKRKASFKVAKAKKGMLKANAGKSELKRGKSTLDLEAEVEAMSKYKGYDITMLPVEARPDNTKNNVGLHSFTLSFNKSTVEILLAKQAFFVKKCNENGTGQTGQISWPKFDGPHKAWAVAKERSGFDRYAPSA